MDKPRIPEVLPIMRAYRDKPGNGVGGKLHIVLDDGNVNDDSVKFCRQEAEKIGDSDGVALADLLLRMSKTQRRKLSSQFYG